MLSRILKWLGKGLLLLVLLSLAITLIFRWAPLPTSALMMIRSGEMQAAGRPIKRDYRWVSLDDISPNLQKAVVAAEDQRFYEHYGFDFEAIEKAVEHNKISKRKKGASTIRPKTCSSGRGARGCARASRPTAPCSSSCCGPKSASSRSI
jgi:monofunctional biosynthetic peptidoglycan transglycosylase